MEPLKLPWKHLNFVEHGMETTNQEHFCVRGNTLLHTRDTVFQDSLVPFGNYDNGACV